MKGGICLLISAYITQSRYGGVYLDTDVILLKPLDLLHNTVCKEMLKNTKTRLNGAVMAFDKGRYLFFSCIKLYHTSC